MNAAATTSRTFTESPPPYQDDITASTASSNSGAGMSGASGGGGTVTAAPLMMASAAAVASGSPGIDKDEWVSTKGRHFVLRGRKILLRGLSWFGFETDALVPHGLWCRTLDSMLDQVTLFF
jgi:endoglucanase